MKINFAKIKRMVLLWRMWQMVRRLHLIQRHNYELEIRDEKDPNVLNQRLFRGTETYVPRHLLSLRDYKKDMLLGTTDEFNTLPRERFDSQNIVDKCIEAGFMKKGNPEKGKSVALTEKGIEFIDPFFFLKYLITELGVVYTFFFTILTSSVVTGIFTNVELKQKIYFYFLKMIQ